MELTALVGNWGLVIHGGGATGVLASSHTLIGDGVCGGVKSLSGLGQTNGGGVVSFSKAHICIVFLSLPHL